MHKDCFVCRSEGFTAHTRILLRAGKRQVIATLYQVTTDLIAHDEAALSESAWMRLGLQDGDMIGVSHPDPVDSLSDVRSRIYGKQLSEALCGHHLDVVDGKYSDIHLSSFSRRRRPAIDHNEILALTQAMVEAGDRLSWKPVVVDKHSVGGLPGNRTTPIVVPIVASLGLDDAEDVVARDHIARRHADTMETMAPVELDTDHPPRRRAGRRMHRLGRRSQAQPGG